MKARVRIYALWLLTALFLINWIAWRYVSGGDFLRVTFFDVGQGDAIYIETSQGHRMLIDGGPNRKVVEKVGENLPFWARSIDLVVLTHPDADHITGLVAVLEEYEVKNVLWTGATHTSAIFAAWEKALGQEGARAILARAPQRLTWSRNAEYQFMDVLFPEAGDAAIVKSPNEFSVVAKLVFGGSSFLFTGDITSAAEQTLVDRGVNIAADVLKVPHHGSKTSNSESFLTAVSPRVAVIQVGRDNRYDHPAQEVLGRLSDFGIPILRNDLQGDIMLVYDPSKDRTNISYH